MKSYSPAKIALGAVLALAVLLLAVRYEGPKPEAQTSSEASSAESISPSPNDGRPSTNSVAAGAQRSGITLVSNTLVSNSGSGLKGKNGLYRIPLTKRNSKDVEEDYVNNANLAPRKSLPKGPLTIPKGEDLEITVKFLDTLLARATPEGELSLPVDIPIELSELNLEVPIGFRPAFDAASKRKLQDLQKRAAERSRTNQADFEGTVVITLPKETTRADRIAVAKAFHRLGAVEYVELVALDNLPPPPADIAPPTPNLESSQGYRNSEAASGGGNAAYAFSRGIKGQGIRISDCEYGFNPNHEDLVDSDITDSSRGPFHPTVVTNGWDKHGTAALGISGATENGYGVTGIAPLAEIHFYSEWTDNGARRRESVTDAIADSDFGDVVLLEMQTVDGEGNYVPAEYNSTIWNLVKAGSDAGVIVVAAAGNGGRNLDDAYFSSYHARGDSGSIIIGAGNESSTHTRKSFSTYGNRVNVQAWGGGVYTTGYGSHATYGGDINQRYAKNFNGTSSASAIAAPSVASIQSYCEQVLGYRLGPIQMRSLLEDTGVKPATDQRIGPHINIRNAILNFMPISGLTCSDNLADRVVVSWTGTSSATDYEVYRGPSTNSGEALLIGSSGGPTQFTDSTIPPGTTHYYFVRPVTPAGVGEWSTAVSGTTSGFEIFMTSSTDTGISDSDGITQDSTPDITAVSTPNTSITISSNLDGVVGNASSDSGGAWTVTLLNLSEGTHQISAVETGGRSSTALTIVVDTTPASPPSQLEILAADDTGISSSDGITNNGSPRFTGVAPPGTRIDLYLNGGTLLDQAPSDGTFTTGAKPISEGTHTISGRSIDVAGNVSANSSAETFTVDQTAPGGLTRRAPDQALSVSDGPFDFEIEFDEPVTGFSRADVAVGGSARGINVFTGQGPVVFTARVADASAEGNVFVNVVENSYEDIAGNAGAAVSGEETPVFLDYQGNTILDLEPASSASIQSLLDVEDQDRFEFTIADARHFSFQVSAVADAIASITNADGIAFFERGSDASPSTDTNMDLALPPGTYIVELSDPEGSEASQYEFILEQGENANSQPDCRVGKSVASSRGNDIYHSMAGQVYTLKSRKARRVRGVLAVENDGDYQGTFRVGGNGGSRLFRVSYRAEGRNVTADVLLFRHETSWIAPAGSPAVILADIRPSKKRLIKKTKRGKKYLRKTHRLSFLTAGMVEGTDRGEIRVKTR